MSDGLGKMIRVARMKKGWTQADLAERINASAAYVSQIETGARKWPQELITPIAEALGCDEAEMAEAAGLIKLNRKSARPLPDPDDPRNQLVEIARSLAPVKLDTALRLLRALHESRTGWT
jgi:transcriptional regulator with XRE-family HTH domain